MRHRQCLACKTCFVLASLHPIARETYCLVRPLPNMWFDLPFYFVLLAGPLVVSGAIRGNEALHFCSVD